MQCPQCGNYGYVRGGKDWQKDFIPATILIGVVTFGVGFVMMFFLYFYMRAKDQFNPNRYQCNFCKHIWYVQQP